jgi:hypothetical protein
MRVDRRVKDLSVHRSTATLFESAAMSRRSLRTWRGPTGMIRLLMTTLAGLALAALVSPVPFAAADSTSPKPKKGSGAKPPASSTSDEASDDAPQKAGTKSSSDNGKPAADDSQGAADEPPSIFSISKPLTTDDAWKTWSHGKGRGEYNGRVHAGELDHDAQQIISNGIRQQVDALTLPTQRDKLHQIVAEILRSAHAAADSKDPGVQRAFRESMFREIVAECRKLEDNQFHVRLSAAILLGNLFTVNENMANRTPPEFYTEAYDALLSVLGQPGQPEAIKVVAVNGLRNLALYGNPPLEPSRKIRLAKRLRDELDKPNTCEWYQERLCEALGSIDQIFDLDGKPFIVHGLAKVLFDHDRPLCARAAAARALGRAQLPPTIDLNVVAYGIADLSRQIGEARNERKKHVRRWCIDDVLLAFKPKDSLEKARRAGLLDRVEEPTFQKYKESIKEVYSLVRPMIVQEHREANAAFPPEVLAHIAEWLKSHTPAQLRIDPGLPPIATTQVTKKE